MDISAFIGRMCRVAAELLCGKRFVFHGALLPYFGLLRPFQLRPPRLSGIRVRQAASSGTSLSRFYGFVLGGYRACGGRAPLVCGTPAFLFAAVCPFPACRAQTPVRGEPVEPRVDGFRRRARFCGQSSDPSPLADQRLEIPGRVPLGGTGASAAICRTFCNGHDGISGRLVLPGAPDYG